jgi:hypothetical protein
MIGKYLLLSGLELADIENPLNASGAFLLGE